MLKKKNAIKDFFFKGFYKNGHINNWVILISYIILAVFVFYGVLILQDKTFLSGYDNLTQTYAWLYKQWASLHNGEIALWDFQPGGGSSFIGELQTAPLYPMNILFSLLVPDFQLHYVNIYIALHFVLASYFMYLCLKEHGINQAASYIGGIFFSYIAISGRAYAQANIFMAMVWFPIILLCLKRACESSRKLYKNYYMYFTGILLAVSFLAGHMQPFLHNVIAMGIWVLFFSEYHREKLRKSGGFLRNVEILACIGIICAMMASGQIIACFEYMGSSYRWIGLDEPIRGLGAIPSEAYDLYVLDFQDFRNIVDSRYAIPEACSMFLSAAGVIFVIFAFFSNRRRVRNFALTITVFGLICALGKNSIIGKEICRLPLLNMIREPIRYLYLYNIGTSFLIALGIHTAWNTIPKVIAQKTAVKISRSVMLLLTAVCFVVLAGLLNQKKFEDYNEVVQAYEQTDALKFLEARLHEEGDQYRIINENKTTLPANIGNVISNFFTTDSQRATLGINYFDYLCRDWNFASDNFKFLGTKYLLSREKKDVEGFQLLYSDGIYYVYERENAASMFWQVGEDGDKIPCREIEKAEWKTNQVTITGDFSDGLFVFTQSDYPGWKVLVDGKEKELISYDIFMSVKLSQGIHEIKFIYVPVWIYLWVATCLPIIILLVISLTGIRRTGGEGNGQNSGFDPLL